MIPLLKGPEYGCQEAAKNGHAERLLRTINKEEVNQVEFCDFYDARRRIGALPDVVDQHECTHFALGYLTVVESEEQERAHPTSR
ncbi:MAG: hypothetical protein IT331_08620 [Anaerolineae bacterium]|nr:hypothetical protein [Anaerolineae bacterium]